MMVATGAGLGTPKPAPVDPALPAEAARKAGQV